MVVMAALGGAGTLFGPLAGAIILVPLQEMSNAWLGGGGTGAAYVAYGVIIMLIARFSPRGLAQWMPRLRNAAAEAPCCLRQAASSRRSAASARWTGQISRSRRTN